MKKDMPSRWIYDYFNPYEVHKHAIKGTLYYGNSGIQEIAVAESHCFGRCLILDNEFQSSEVDEFIYHEALVAPALTLHPMPKKVAIIGGGEGASLREALRYKTVNRVVMVDIDREVIECAKKYLPSFHNGSFSDERTEVIYHDGRRFIEETDETFDVIIIDITCPLEEGPAYKLFTREFYEIVMQRLTSQGIVAVQASTTALGALKTYSIIVRTLSQVFSGVFPYAAYIPFFALQWGFCLATQGIDPIRIARDEIDRRISERVGGDLRFYDGITHHGIFNLPKYIRTVLKEQSHVNRDNQPFMEMFPGIHK